VCISIYTNAVHKSILNSVIKYCHSYERLIDALSLAHAQTIGVRVRVR